MDSNDNSPSYVLLFFQQIRQASVSDMLNRGGFFIMTYDKPPLSFEDQAALLISRGLQAPKEALSSYLSRINYYRLSGCLYNFRKSEDDDTFTSGTSLEKIRQIYNVDQKFRLLIFNAIHSVEISVLRSRLVELFALKYGKFCYVDRANYKDKSLHPIDFHENILLFARQTLSSDQSDYIKRYRQKYHDEHYLPFWILIERMTFGQLSFFYGNMRRKDRKQLSEQFGQPATTFASWMQSLSYIRNMCAHHERIWNRYLSVRPAIPRKHNYPDFHDPVEIEAVSDRILAVLAILQYLLNYIHPENTFGQQIMQLIDENPDLDFSNLGFNDNWKEFPYWQFS